jgi:hypothetical protein
MLEPILQQLGAGNPQLAQMITSNPEQFLQLLGEDDEGDAALPPGAQTISVTEEESEAIERVSRNILENISSIDYLFYFSALPPWLRAQPRHSGILRVRQE